MIMELDSEGSRLSSDASNEDGFMGALAKNHFLVEKLEEGEEDDYDTFMTASAQKKHRGEIEREMFQGILEEMKDCGISGGILKEINENIDHYRGSLGHRSTTSLLKKKNDQSNFNTLETEYADDLSELFVFKSSVNIEKKENFGQNNFDVKSSYQGFNQNKENRIKIEKEKKSRFNRLTRKVKNYQKENSKKRFRISKTYKQRTGSIYILDKYPPQEKKNLENKNLFFENWEFEKEKQKKFGKFVKNENRAKDDLFHLLGFDDIYQSNNFKDQVEMVKEGKLRGSRSNFKLLKNLKLRKSKLKNHNSVSTFDTRDYEYSKRGKEGQIYNNRATKPAKKSLKSIVISRNKWRERKKRAKPLSFTSSLCHKHSNKSTKSTLNSTMRDF